MRTQRFSTAALAFLGMLFIGLATAAAEDKKVELKPIPIADVKHEGPVDFEKEILPILKRSCLACHNATDAESDLVLETPQTILKGGSDGPSVVAGKSGESLMLLVAANMKKPIMPPAGNQRGAKPLTSEELGLVKLWIDQGAKGEVKGTRGPIAWQPLPPGVNPIYAVAVSPYGNYVAAGRANQIFMYNVGSKQELGRLTDPELLTKGPYKKPGVADLDLIQSLAFSPDGQWLASGGYRTVKLWRRPLNVRKGDLAGLESPASSLAVGAGGKLAAIGEASGKIKVFDVATKQIVKKFEGHTGPVTGVSFSADGAKLASGSQDGTLRVWDLAEGKQTGIVTTPSPITAVALVGEDKLVAAAHADFMIRTWSRPDLPAPAPAEPKKEGAPEGPQPIKQLAGHSALVTSLAAIGPAGAQLLSGSHDTTVRVWDVNAGTVVRQMGHASPVAAIAVRGDAQRFASVGESGIARLWNAADGAQKAEIKGDFRTRFADEELLRSIDLAKRLLENAKADLKVATDSKTAEENNGKMAIEAEKKAQEDLKAKTEATVKPLADKAAADKELETAKAELTKAETDKKTTAETAVKTDEAFKKAQADKEAATKAATDADAAKKAALEAKAAADKAVVDADAAAKAAAGGTDEKAKTDTAAAAKAAADKKVVTDKAAADAEAAATKAAEAKVAADKAFTDAEAKKKADDEAKVKAEAAFAAADGKFKAADPKAKAATAAATKATEDKAAAERTLQGAMRAITRSQESIKKATEALPVAEAAMKQREMEVAKVEEEKKAADKKVADLTAAIAAATQAKAAADGAAAQALAKVKQLTDAQTAAAKVLADMQAAAKVVADAGTKAVTDAQAELKAAADKKVVTDKAAADTEAAKKAALEAKVAADKAVVDTDAAAKAAAGGTDEKAKTDTAAAAKAAAEKKVVTDKAAADAEAAAKAAADAKVAADKVATDADTKVKTVTEAATKANTDATAKVTDATNKKAEADKQVTDATAAAKAPLDAKAAADKAIFDLQKPMYAVAFSTDGSQLATAGENQLVQLWSAEDGAPADILEGQKAAIGFLAYTADNGLLSVGRDNSVVLWDAAPEWKLERTIGSPDAGDALVDRVTALGFSPDSKVLATGSGEPSRSGQLKLWNVADGALVREVKDAHSDTIFGLEFSPDGTMIASCAADRFVKVHMVADGKHVKSFEGHTHHVLGVSWRADSRVLVSSGADNVIKVWNFLTGEQQTTIQGFGKEVTSIQYLSATDNFVISCGDKQVATRNSGGGGGPAFAGGTDFMYNVRASRDGKTVASGGQDSTVRIYKNDGNLIIAFAPPKAPDSAAVEKK